MTGRFESTVPYYAKYREPYPSEFFQTIAERLCWNGHERLIDIGCGPGLLAIGFVPYVGSCVGVDIEPRMLEAARSDIERAAVNVQLVESRIEDLPANIGAFEVVTIGRAIHWFDPVPAKAALDRITVTGSCILICRSSASSAGTADWPARFEELKRSWSSDPTHSRYRINLDEWFAASPFTKVTHIEVSITHTVSIDDLIGRALSRSNTSPEFLGSRRPEFEAAIRNLLQPFSDHGTLEEKITAVATVFRK